MSNYVLWLVLPVLLMQSSSGAPDVRPASAMPNVEYHFQNERFLISKIDLELDPTGRGRLVFVRKGLTKPVSRDVSIAPEILVEIDRLFGRLGYLESNETYQTEKDHSNLGEVVIAVVRGEMRREAKFNYTANRDMASVQTMLRGIANREIYVFDIETAAQFQPLDTPRLLQTLGDEIDAGRLTGVDALLPLLRRLADDVSLPLIARNRAASLVAKVEKARAER